MTKQIIAVAGGTGAQGGGVVEALLEGGRFAVRVLTRNPSGEQAKALSRRGVEVVRADLNRQSGQSGSWGNRGHGPQFRNAFRQDWLPSLFKSLPFQGLAQFPAVLPGGGAFCSSRARLTNASSPKG